MSKKSSRAWTWRHAVVSSEISGDCKHLLLTLSIYMNEMGESCFPTIELLMKSTGKGKTWIHKYLNEAIKAGWIERSSVSQKYSNRDNRGWRRNEYVAIWPEHDLPSESQEFYSQHHEKGSSPDEPPIQEGGSRETKGSSPQGTKVVREANTILPDNIPENIPSSSELDVLDKTAISEKEDEGLKSFEEKGSGYWDQQFLKLVKAHPGAAHLPTAKWKIAFLELNEDIRQQASDRHSAWVDLLKKQGRKFFPSLREYFEESLFDGIKPKSDPVEQIPLKPYSKDWLAHRFWLLAQGSTGTFKPTAMQQKMIDAGRDDLILRDRLLAEYRKVAALDADAFNGATRTLPDRGQMLSGSSEKIEVGTESWQKWQDFHVQIGWPWIEPPRHIKFVIVPISLSELDHSKAIEQINHRRKT